MTNAEAIKWLKDYIKTTDFPMPQYEEALEMGIKALTQVKELREYFESLTVKDNPYDVVAYHPYKLSIEQILEVIDRLGGEI